MLIKNKEGKTTLFIFLAHILFKLILIPAMGFVNGKACAVPNRD